MNGIAVLPGIPGQYETRCGRADHRGPGRRQGVGEGGGRVVLGLHCTLKRCNHNVFISCLDGVILELIQQEESKEVTTVDC